MDTTSISAKNVPLELKQRLKATAKKEDIDESKLIRRTLDEHLPSLKQVSKFLA